ncbi:MAG: type II toxin-antitoxin system RelE/ParE family toxin [Firmicutes bacterium]|nr:type II toxin-antitoxin system RelE/ParE family toxin [Bacillota bacterium]
MIYRLRTSKRFDKEFRKLDRYTQKMIKVWVMNNLQECEDPRAKGKKLADDRAGQWRYRIGDYRLICEIQDDALIILALAIGHRKSIYNR